MLRTAALTILFCAALNCLNAQEFPEKKIKKRLKAVELVMDPINGDAVFMALGKNDKWGMYQWDYVKEKAITLIPMEYDSLLFFEFNASYTVVWQNNLLGLYQSKWSYVDAKQTVACAYEDYYIKQHRGRKYCALKKDGKWGWVDWLTGEEMTEFIYENKSDLPLPHYEQHSY